VMRVGELLQPVVAAMRKDLLREGYLQADETTVPVQMHDKRKRQAKPSGGISAAVVRWLDGEAKCGGSGAVAESVR